MKISISHCIHNLLTVFLLAFCIAPTITRAATFEGMETLHQGGDPERVIDIVYVSLGFQEGNNNLSYDLLVEYSANFRFISPFSEYQSYFNIYRLDINSTLSETSAVQDLAIEHAPAVDLLIFVRNQSGSAVTNVAGISLPINHSNSVSTAHELGHAIGGLGDEYRYGTKCPSTHWSGGEPSFPNLTINEDLSTLKWKEWLSMYGGTLGSPVQGGNYCATGIWRPTSNSIMRSGTNFDPVGREWMIRRLNDRVNPVISQSPASMQLNIPSTPSTLHLSAPIDLNILPQGANPIVQWVVAYDNNSPFTMELIPGATTTELDFDLSTIPPGNITSVYMEVLDPDINDYARMGLGVGLASFLSPTTPLIGRVAWSISINDSPPPTITFIYPPSAKVGDFVSVQGSDFCGTTACDVNRTRVSINNGPLITPVYVAPTFLYFVVPSGTSSGPITVTRNGVPSLPSAQPFTVIIPAVPTISFISPPSAKVGNYVAVFGTDFCIDPCVLANTNIKINNGPAITPEYVSPTLIYFVVPAGASSGSITATYDGVTSPPSTQTFTVLVNPVITNVTPQLARVGNTVEIWGTDLCVFQCNVVSPANTETTVILNTDTGPIELNLTKVEAGILNFVVPPGFYSADKMTITTPGGSNEFTAFNFLVY